MKIFIDTADVEAIRKAKEMGFISGVTTNPSLIAAEGKDFHTVIKEIASIVDGPVSAEVLSETAEEMIAEGQVLAGLDPHVVRRGRHCWQPVRGRLMSAPLWDVSMISAGTV